MNLIANTGTQRAAKSSRVLVGSAYLTYASWEATCRVADLPTTNFESFNAADDETYEEGIRGVLGCDVRFGGAWDAAAKPTGAAPGLYPRDNLATVQLITHRTDNTFWSFPYLRVRSVQNTGAVEALVLFNVQDAKNQGRFILP